MLATIDDRIDRIDYVASMCVFNSGNDASDLVVDLMHWCTARDFALSDVIDVALPHFQAETKEAARLQAECTKEDHLLPVADGTKH
jgi:hypothetical protein